VAEPKLDASQIASALKVRNFKLLLETAETPENLALAMELSVPRILELCKGEHFTAETAHFIEMTLGLPSGFLDQANPKLTPEIEKRLKFPLEFQKTELEVEDDLKSSLPVAKAETVTTGSPAVSSAAESAPVLENAMPKSAKAKNAATASAPLSIEELFVVRRNNLGVLTAIPGSKKKLGDLRGLSAANVSHRLHGTTKLDNEEILKFSEALQLHPSWFDTPKNAEDIPAATAQLLTPDPRAPRGPGAAKTAATSATPAIAKAKPGRRPGSVVAAAPNAAGSKVLIPADVSKPKLSVGLGVSKDPGKESNAASAGAAPALESASAAPVASVKPASSTKPQPRSTAAVAAQPAGAPQAIFSPEDLEGVGPIAVALVKTLTIKARQGKLDETRAMSMLQEAHML
jgi:hypothetical protein